MSTKNTEQPENNLYHEYLQAIAHFTNYTNSDLHLKSAELSWGKWMKKPDQVIKNMRTGTFSSQGLAYRPTGTEGEVVYAIADAFVTIKYNVPNQGDNFVQITCSSDKYRVEAEITQGRVGYIKASIR